MPENKHLDLRKLKHREKDQSEDYQRATYIKNMHVTKNFNLHFAHFHPSIITFILICRISFNYQLLSIITTSPHYKTHIISQLPIYYIPCNYLLASIVCMLMKPILYVLDFSVTLIKEFQIF